jgi:hypothetical protein
MKNYKLKFHIIKQLYFFNKYWLPKSIQCIFEKEMFNFFSIDFYFPVIRQGMDLVHEIFDSDNYTKAYGVEFATEIIYVKSDCHWAAWIKIFGMGIGVNRQWGY